MEVVNLYVVLIVVCGTCGENNGGVDGIVDVSGKNYDGVDGNDGDSSVYKLVMVVAESMMMMVGTLDICTAHQKEPSQCPSVLKLLDTQ